MDVVARLRAAGLATDPDPAYVRQNHAGPSLKHDVSVPIGDLPAFVERAGAALRAVLPGVRLVTYGHVGDGNLHYNLSKPVGTDDAAFLARADELARIVVLGLAQAEMMASYKSPVELTLMRGLKQLLDPTNLMNPGKVLPSR
jgi:FAD/FMN-containing dehydrogenase